MTKTNKELIIEGIRKYNETSKKYYPEQENLVLGGYDETIEKLSKKELKEVIEAISGDSTDIDVKLNRKLHVVEISVVGNEIDFNMLTQNEYINRYGNERWYN